MNRHSDKKKANTIVPILRKMAVHHDLAIESTGREADDLLRIWAGECRAVGREFVICSIDKDLKMIPGMHYNMNRDEMEEISEQTAMQHYYCQLLSGDPTDNIPGLPGIGPKTAPKLVAHCVKETEFQEVIVERYFQEYGQERWYEYFLSNAKMIHLQEHTEDYFDPMKWPLVKELVG
jgi:5'-3' exonuclease